MAITTLKVLNKLEKLLSDPERWCKGVLALDSTGKLIDPRGDDACKFCMSGAVTAACGTNRRFRGLVMTRLYTAAVDYATQQQQDRVVWSIPSFNDAETTTHDDVMKVIRIAKKDVRSSVAKRARKAMLRARKAKK